MPGRISQRQIFSRNEDHIFFNIITNGVKLFLFCLVSKFARVRFKTLTASYLMHESFTATFSAIIDANNLLFLPLIPITVSYEGWSISPRPHVKQIDIAKSF